MIFYLTIYCKTVQSTAQIEVLFLSLSLFDNVEEEWETEREKNAKNWNVESQ